jgi:ParB family chromosome partitioning protein
MAVFDFLKEKKPVQPVVQSESSTDEGRRLVELLVSEILPNPNQPRKTFDDEALLELAESIRQVGLIQPLVVRRAGKTGYELVAGERRLRACKLINMERVQCILEESMVDEESAMIALIENLQRENLHYLEEAECYAVMLEAYHMTQEQLAERLGKSQSAVANKLRILKLPPAVQQAMLAARMTERHARALLRLRDEEAQLSIIGKVQGKALSVKDTEKLVEKTLNKQYDEKIDGAAPRPKILRYLRDYRLFVNSVHMAANQLRDAGVLVEIAQTDFSNGMDLLVKIRRKD